MLHMQKIFYLHLGNHKTGTTSIQHFLSNNRNELNKINFSYPEVHEKEFYNLAQHNVAYDLCNHKSFDNTKKKLSV